MAAQRGLLHGDEAGRRLAVDPSGRSGGERLGTRAGQHTAVSHPAVTKVRPVFAAEETAGVLAGVPSVQDLAQKVAGTLLFGVGEKLLRRGNLYHAPALQEYHAVGGCLGESHLV